MSEGWLKVMTHDKSNIKATGYKQTSISPIFQRYQLNQKVSSLMSTVHHKKSQCINANEIDVGENQ